MRLKIFHRTTYSYSLPARSNINELRLAPEETQRQEPGPLEIRVNPDSSLQEARDLFGNLVHSFEVEEKHAKLEIIAESEVTTNSDAALPARAGQIELPKSPEFEDELVHEFLVDCTFVERNTEMWREAIDIRLNCEPTYGSIVEGLSNFIFDSCTYRDQVVHRMTSAAEVQQDKIGTCQDFAHLLLGYCRSLEIPARYVSGYLHDPGIDEGEQPEFIGAEATHAWVDVFVPQVGWVGIDPTNRCWINDHYVTVAFGRDYHDVAPVRGSLLGGGRRRSIDVEVAVKAL
ncbi:MAG: transglutaminase family protein [Verrucomicrobiota bacterium]